MTSPNIETQPERLREAVIYLTSFPDSPHRTMDVNAVGALLYMADSYVHDWTGESATGSTYHLMPGGPWPTNLSQVYSELAREQAIAIVTRPDGARVTTEIAARRYCDPSVFTADQFSFFQECAGEFPYWQDDQLIELARYFADRNNARLYQPVPLDTPKPTAQSLAQHSATNDPAID